MVYRLVYTNSAQRNLKNLPQKKVRRVLKKLSEYIHSPHPLKLARKLKGLKHTHYRYRIGDYRVIFRIDSKTKKLVILIVLKIAHRKDVY